MVNARPLEATWTVQLFTEYETEHLLSAFNHINVLTAMACDREGVLNSLMFWK